MFKYVIIILMLCSCYTPNKARKNLDKAKIHYPEIVAKKSSEWFPCDVTIDSSEKTHWYYKTDTLIRYVDNESDTIRMILKDTLFRYYNGCDNVMRQLKKANFLISHLKNQVLISPIVYYKTVVDSARNVYLSGELDKSNTKLEVYRRKYEKSTTISFWLLALLTLSILINIFKFRK